MRPSSYLFSCLLLLALNNITAFPQENDHALPAITETNPPQFTSKYSGSGKILTNKKANKLCEEIAKINPSSQNPFPSGIEPIIVEKRKMLPPKKSKSQERRSEKERKEEKNKKPQEKDQVKKTSEQIEREQQQEKLNKYLQLDAREICKHPSAKNFPGEVPQDAKRINKAYTSDNEIRDWQCTGLYAPPGEIIKVHIAKAGVNTGYKIRIGTHTDDLRTGTKKSYWKRFPVISREFPVNNDTIELASPFGGMIYVFAPAPPQRKKIVRDSSPRIPQRVRFQFINVVEAPLFEIGKTKPNEWSYLKNAPAPWAELIGKKFKVTLPTYAIRNLEDPTELIKAWDKIIETQNKLSANKKEKETKEHIVFDADSIGAVGHPGETLVCPLELVQSFTNLEFIREHGSWGIFFLLAKNRVSPDWTFYGNSDVPAALIALCSMEQVSKKKPSNFFDIPALHNLAFNEPLKAGTPELIALYIPIIETFGWSSLQKTFNTYNNAKKPKTETEIDKYENFIILWSKASQQNLCPYFEKFGFPYSDRQKRILAKLKNFQDDKTKIENNPQKTNPAGFLGIMPLGNIDCFFDDFNFDDLSTQQSAHNSKNEQ